MEKIKFSIITPVYNREKVVKRCIKSVLTQKYDNFEFIIIDDGSTDDSKNVIESFSNNDERVFFISYQKNRGVNYARNRGIEKAKGDYIIFLDSDDWFIDNALQRINTNITINSSYMQYVFTVSDRENDSTLPKNGQETSYKDWLSGKVAGDFTHVINPECFNNKLFFEQFNGYESLNWLRVIKENDPQLFINEVITYRERERDDCLSRKLFNNNLNKIKEKFTAESIYFNLYLDDLVKFNCLPYERIQKAIIFGKILNKKMNNLNKIYIKRKPLQFFLIKLVPAKLLKLLITLNAKRKLR